MSVRRVKAVLLSIAVAALLFSLGARPPDKVVALPSTDDTYVVADTSDESDPQKLREQVLGNLDFVRTWYAWQVLGSEKIVAVSLVKFDLAPVRGKEISSAHLQLFATGASLRQPVRLVDVHAIPSPIWSQKTINYNGRPAWEPAPIATTAVYGPGAWYSWDVSGQVISQINKSEAASFAVALRVVDDKSEEQVVFASSEAGNNGPRLLIAYKDPGGIAWYYIAATVAAAFGLILGAFMIGRRINRRPGAEPPAAEIDSAADEAT